MTFDPQRCVFTRMKCPKMSIMSLFLFFSAILFGIGRTTALVNVADQKLTHPPTYMSSIYNYLSSVKPKPQLSLTVFAWVGTVLFVERLHGRNCELLVFGAGHDSKLWDMLNLGGSTDFLESDREWVGKISAEHPSLKLHLVSYKYSIEQMDTFLQSPREMDLPASVGQCSTVCIVDAPPGWASGQPGRLESIFTATRRAERCACLQNRPFYVYVHDVNRPVEKTLIDRFLESKQHIVSMGQYALMAGYTVGCPSTVP